MSVPTSSYLIATKITSCIILSVCAYRYSDDALLALVEFAHKEMWKRTHPSSGCNGLSFQGQGMRSAAPIHEKRKSSPSILPPTLSSKVGTTSMGGNKAGTAHTHRRPRSKSGGSECAIRGREEGVVASTSSTSTLMPSPNSYGTDDYDNCCYSHRSMSSVGEDELSANDSGRVRPVEKMLGLTPGYLRKPSPASSPAHFSQGGSIPKGNSRSSPWLVFDPPLNQGNQSPVQHSAQSSNSNLCRQSPSSPSPARPFTSSSPICIGSSGAGNSTITGGGPIRLPAKKVTCVPVTLFSPEEHGEKRRKGDYFTLGNRYDDDDSHSFVSVTSSIGSGLDKDIVANRSLQQQLQQLIISPRTAFDDISVSSSEGSSNIRKTGYRKSPAHATVTGKQKR